MIISSAPTLRRFAGRKMARYVATLRSARQQPGGDQDGVEVEAVRRVEPHPEVGPERDRLRVGHVDEAGELVQQGEADRGEDQGRVLGEADDERLDDEVHQPSPVARGGTRSPWVPVPTPSTDGARTSGAAPAKRATIVSAMVVIDEMAPRRSLRETEDRGAAGHRVGHSSTVAGLCPRRVLDNRLTKTTGREWRCQQAKSRRSCMVSHDHASLATCHGRSCKNSASASTGLDLAAARRQRLGAARRRAPGRPPRGAERGARRLAGHRPPRPQRPRPPTGASAPRPRRGRRRRPAARRAALRRQGGARPPRRRRGSPPGAVELLAPDDTIYLDSGSTVLGAGPPAPRLEPA